jgi:hypothetical protein
MIRFENVDSKLDIALATGRLEFEYFESIFQMLISFVMIVLQVENRPKLLTLSDLLTVDIDSKLQCNAQMD